MAITPQDAKKLSEKDKLSVNALEKKIDEALIEGGYTFSADLFPNNKVMRQIMQLYRNAGWKVEYMPDQRDGDYLHIRE